MSCGTDNSLPQKENALMNFPFYDKKAYSANLYQPTSLQPIKPTSTLIITGYIPSNAIRFSINLLCKSSGNTALHFNPRLDRGYVVRNSRVKNCWENEETTSHASPAKKFFQRNSYIHLTIFCTLRAFQIAVNGEHFCEFKYRLPLEDIATFDTEGSFQDVKIRQIVSFVYPNLEICNPIRPNFILIADFPLTEDLELPLTVAFGRKLCTNDELFITGRLKLLPHSFYINLQKGESIYPHPTIALHLNPRFFYGYTKPCIVMNSWMNGNWGNEERHDGHLYWMPSRDFSLKIRCDQDAFTIWLENKMIGEYKHRLQLATIDTLKISGDIFLHKIAVNEQRVS